MDKDGLQQQWQQELKKGRHKDRNNNKDLTPGSEIQSQLQDKSGVESNEQMEGWSKKINQLAQRNFYRNEMNKEKNKEKRAQQEERRMKDISKGAETYADGLNENEKKDKNEKKLKGFFLAIPLAALLDLLDFLTGIFDETVVVAIIRIIVEIMASTALFLWYVGQVGFSGRKQKKNMAKFIIAALLDLIPIITFLPLETVVLFVIWTDQKTGGKLKKSAGKKYMKSKEQKNNIQNNKLEAANSAS